MDGRGSSAARPASESPRGRKPRATWDVLWSKALFFLKRRPKPVALIQAKVAEADRRRRNRQLNIKVHEDCSRAFSALAKAQGMSKAAFLKDMVAERLERLRGQKLKLEG
jgi:hypothetical protein